MVRRLPQIEIDRLVVILHLPDAFRLKFYNSHTRKYNFLRGTRNKILLILEIQLQMQRWLRDREIGSKRKLHLGTRFKHFQLLRTSQESESKRSITYSNDSQWLIGAWGFDSDIEVNTVSIWDSNQYSPRNDARPGLQKRSKKKIVVFYFR